MVSLPDRVNLRSLWGLFHLLAVASPVRQGSSGSSGQAGAGHDSRSGGALELALAGT